MINLKNCRLCTFAESFESQPDAIASGAHFLLRHADETNIPGYVVIVSKRHFLDLSEGSPSECQEFGVLMSKAFSIIRKVTDAERVYTFSLCEAVPHFHVHLIPKTASMPRAYRGRGIMSYPLKPTMDENLKAETISRLKNAWRKVSGVEI